MFTSFISSTTSFITTRWKTSLFVVLLAIGLVFYFVQRAEANKVELVVESPQYRELTKTLDLSGFVDAKEKARLRFAAGGKVVWLGAQEGELVKKGQTIATIDQAALNKQLQQDLNLYMKERWDWEETRDGVKDKTIETSQRRTIDKEQWDLENTILSVEIRDIAIQNTRLSAPFAGILVSSPTTVAGIQLLASDYFEVVNPDSFVFRAAVDESDIGLVSLEQSGALELDAFLDNTFTTKVQYVSFVSTETSSGTAFVIEFPLDQAGFDKPLRIGMNGEIQLLLESKDSALSIPNTAIIQRDGTTYVTVQTDDKQTKEVAVEVGLETDEYIEILSGLSESDKVVIPQ